MLAGGVGAVLAPGARPGGRDGGGDRPEHAVAADVHVVGVLVAPAVGRRRRLRCSGRRFCRDGGLGRRFRGLCGLGGGHHGRSRWLRPWRLRPRPGLRGCERGRGARLRLLGRTSHPGRPLGAPAAPRAAAGPTTCGATSSAARPAPPVVGGAVAAPTTTATTTNAGAMVTAATARRRLVARPRRARRQAMIAGTIATRHNSRPTAAVAGITARSAPSRTMTNVAVPSPLRGRCGGYPCTIGHLSPSVGVTDRRAPDGERYRCARVVMKRGVGRLPAVPMTARYATTCRVCSGPVQPGDEITKA